MRHPDGMRQGFLGVVAILALTSGCAAPMAPSAQGSSTMQIASASPPLPSSASPSLLPTPSADPILSAIGATTSRGTARLALEIVTATPDFEKSLIGEGVVDFTRGAADLRWSGLEGDSREVRTEEGFFVEVQEGQWLAVDPGRTTPTSDAGDVLRGIDGIRDPVVEGSESVDGQSAIRITGWLPVTQSDASNAAGLGLIDDDFTTVVNGGQARVQVTIWVDDSGRIIRVMRTLQGSDAIAATSLARLTEFGVAAPIAAPSSVAATAR